MNEMSQISYMCNMNFSSISLLIQVFKKVNIKHKGSKIPSNRKYETRCTDQKSSHTRIGRLSMKPLF